MDEFDLDRFSSSESYAKNAKDKKSKSKFGTFSFIATGTFVALAFVGLVFIFKGDGKDSSFDELVMTGGAVRRSIPIEARTCPGIEIKECKTTACKDLTKYVKESMADPIEQSGLACTNFYQYACKGWIQRNPIPTTSSTFSTFSKLNQKVEVILHKILNTSDTPHEQGMLRNIKKFYRSCMDQTAINKKGKKPMLDLIKLMGSWDLACDDSFDKETWDFKTTLKQIQTTFTSSGGPLVSIHVSDDPKHSTKHILEVDQAGPSLPREIYLSDMPEKKATIKAYTEYLIDVAYELCKDQDNEECTKENIKTKAEETIAFEKKLAEISVPDDKKQESWFTRSTLKTLATDVKDFPWREHIDAIFAGRTTITDNEPIIVPAIDYLKKMMKVVSEATPETRSNYIIWSVIQDEVPYLSENFLKIRMHYKEKVLGSKGLRARWKTCVSYSNEYLGEILGKLYKMKHFKESAKTTTENMIKNIREAFKKNVDSLSWMDSATKKKVREKAAAMKDQVGYPYYIGNTTRFEEKYKDLAIHDDDLFQNRLNMIGFAHNRMLNKIRKKVDKEEWPMDPQTINAMYSFNQNGMIIPAGILQPPFFHGENLSMAMTYGAIGAILGHELTHGFDNTGRKFNKKGELTEDSWWSNSSLTQFMNRSQCMVDQYNEYKVRGKYQINGKLTLGENIADNGGFKTALRAYNDWLCVNKTDYTLEGLPFTNNQLFFIGFAQAYCSNSRPNEQYLATLNDRHSEEEFRVIGTLSNSVEFGKAFGCTEFGPMNRKKKCSVWVNEAENV